MSKLPVIAVAAVLSTALALPAVAQSSSYTSGATRHHQMSKSHMKRHHAHHHAMHAHRMHHRHHAQMQPGYADRGYGWDGGRSGFLPFDIAGGIIGGAVTTAGAIATAPFGGPATVWGQPYGQPYAEGYGFDRGFLGTYQGYGYNGGRLSPEYVKRNAMACVPGTVIKGESDGRPHLCQ